MVNVSIYGDHVLSVESIRRLLEDEANVNIQATDASSNQQLKDGVIVYCATGYSDALYKKMLKARKASKNLKLVLLISMTHKQFIKKLLNIGIHAIVSYHSSTSELAQAIQLASLNQQFLSSDLSLMIVKSKYPSSFNSLSQRELEITYMLANGMNVKSVSSQLDISPKTVNTYRYRIFNKLEIDRNIELFRIVSQEASYMLNK